MVDHADRQIHKECFAWRATLSLELLHCCLPLSDRFFHLLSVQVAVDCDHVHPLSSLGDVVVLGVAINPSGLIADLRPPGHHIVSDSLATLDVLEQDDSRLESLGVEVNCSPSVASLALIVYGLLSAVQR